MSTYNNNIPQATDRLKDSQGGLLGNFQSIATVVAVNHVPFNASGEGKHKFVEMPVQSPVPVTVAGEVGLYCQTSALTGVPALVFAPQSAGTPIEFTSSLQAGNGWARLPSGVLIKWGLANTAGVQTILFPTGANIPVFNNVFQILATAVFGLGDPNNAVYIGVFNAVSFNALGVNRTSTGNAFTQFSYLAIGN